MAMTPDEALLMLDEALGDEFQVKAAGISAVMDRAEAQQKLAKAMEMVAFRVCVENQLAGPRSDMDRVLQRLSTLPA